MVCPLNVIVVTCVPTISSALSQETLEAFNQMKHAAVFPEGAVIFVEGQTPHGIFMLCQGHAKLSTTTHDGKTFILRIAKPGEILGLDAVVAGKPYELTAETMQPDGKAGPVTRALQQEFDKLVSGRHARSGQWLAPVPAMDAAGVRG